jgi:sugar/nucleoside kinase (ribokinase family)
MGIDLLCVGLTTLDIVGRPVDTLPEEALALVDEMAIAPAGTAAGTAYVAATLGVRTGLASQVGREATGRTVRSLLEHQGVDTRWLAAHPDLPTSTTVILVRTSGVRARFHALGASRAMTIGKDLEAALSGTRFVHYAAVGGTHTDGGPGRELLALARAAGATVTCDLISPRADAPQELARLLPYVDYFMPNASEALALSGADSLEGAAERFIAQGARACIFKDGADGSLFFEQGRGERIPAHAITPEDTTSCGDSYCAGFIAARLKGADEIEACRLGTAVAALVAQGPGTLGRLESYEQAERFKLTAPHHR